MLLSKKVGIITQVSPIVSKAGKAMVILSYTSGNSETLQKAFIYEDDENYEVLKNAKNDLIGTKISQNLEIEV